MILDRFEIINEEFHADAVKPQMLDILLAQAWRHFGTHFFRYNYGMYENEIRRVLPLRIRVNDLQFSKSQLRTIRRNADLTVDICPAEITLEIDDLFHRHKSRFRTGVPASIYDFISSDPICPTDCRCVIVREAKTLVAVSFFRRRQ